MNFRVYSGVILILVCYMVSFFQAKGQSRVFEGKVEKTESATLSSIFNKVEVFGLNAEIVDRYLSEKRSFNDKFSFRLSDGRQWDFNVEPVEILTAETKVYLLTPEGKKEITEKPSVKTYKGFFADGREGQIRLTVSGDFMYGLIRDGDEEYYIEPLHYFEHSARPGKFVFYNSKDIAPDHSSTRCFRPDEPSDHISHDNHDAGRTGNCYKIKLSFVSDYLMYIDPAHPGLDANINHVIGVLNNVHINYEYNPGVNFDDGVNYEVGEIIVSTCSTCDPVSSTQNPNSLLSEFSSWVDQGGFNHPLQSAHFWSNRDFIGSAVGLAFQSANLYCNNRGRAILEDWTTTAALLKTMVSHEIGHNFNGVHDGTTGLILSPTVTATDTWSSTSKTTISGQIAGQSGCFTACGAATCDRVTALAVSNVTTSGFTVSWSPSGSGSYVVKVRELGTIPFINDITVSTNSVTLNPTGYAICKKYDVFVYNKCGGTLSVAQRVLMISPTSQGCAIFSVNNPVGWSGSTITFLNTSLNATSWNWNFGNGQTSTVQNPTVTYSTPGNYDVTLTVNNIHTMTKTAAVRVLPERSPPYTLAQGGDFESNTSDFGAQAFEGTTNVWEFGTTNYVLATQGNAWKSYLNADIPQVTSKSGLFSPRYNMTGYQNYQVHFDIGMETQFCNGPVAVQLQYSTDNGTTWTRLGTAPDFYNAGPGQFCEIATQLFSDKYGWTLNQNYLHKSIDVSFLSGSPSVIFRFVTAISSVFTGGYAVDGVLIDNFRIDAQNQIILPLDVSSLKARAMDDHVLLTWKSYSADEIRNYNIYKSTDGNNWIKIGIVQNNADQSPDYSFKDYFPVNGLTYYKVGASRHDGKEEFTNIAGVWFGAESSVVIYPNPVQAGHPVYIAGFGADFAIKEITLTDRLGRQTEIREFDPSTGRIEPHFLTPGLYFLKVMSVAGQSRTIKISVIE